MRGMLHKLKSQSGVTILLALLFLLVGAMVSAVIISGSVTSVKRVHDDKSWEQERLALDSAGRLVRELIGNVEVSVVTTTSADSLTTQDVSAVDETRPLARMLAMAVEKSQTNGYQWSFTVNPQESVAPVKAVCNMAPATSEDSADVYKTTIVLTLEEEGEQCLYVVASRGTAYSPETHTDEYGNIVVSETVAWNDVTLSTTGSES